LGGAFSDDRGWLADCILASLIGAASGSTRFWSLAVNALAKGGRLTQLALDAAVLVAAAAVIVGCIGACLPIPSSILPLLFERSPCPPLTVWWPLSQSPFI